MIVDNELVLSDEQAITGDAGSTNVIDLGPGSPTKVGRGMPMYVVFIVKEAFTDSSSNSTVAITIESDNDSAFGSPTTAVQTIGTFAALSPVGTKFVRRLQNNVASERYIRAKYTVANGNLTTGKITAFLTPTPDDWEAVEAPDVIEQA